MASSKNKFARLAKKEPNKAKPSSKPAPIEVTSSPSPGSAKLTAAVTEQEKTRDSAALASASKNTSDIHTAEAMPNKQVSEAVAPAAKVASKRGKKTLPSETTQPSVIETASVGTPAVETKLESNLAKQPPRALNSPIRIFQIYFEAWQRELLDPAFYPLDNSRSTSELMEFAVFEQLQKNAVTQDATLWGALSWRFGEKTGMSGADLVKQIVDHPGYDVYFCNPHPYNEALYHNMWMQGEVSHPQFVSIVTAFYAAAGLDPKELKEIEPSTSFTAANYFVATPAFWTKFIPFIKRVLVTADKRLNPTVRDLLHSKVADDKGLHPGATYVPFIVERLFLAFMRSEGKQLKAYKISLPERERELNVHLKLLREMKDVAHRTKSAWLAACWVNYRNLYFSQTNGKEWCEKHLRSITPTEVVFGG